MNKFFNMISAQIKALKECSAGATVIEFALVVPLFLVMTFTTFEIGYLQVKRSLMENAMMDLSREIYTGQARGITADDALSIFCGRVDNVLDCQNSNGNLNDNLTIEVLSLSDYNNTAIGQATCIDSSNATTTTKPLFENVDGGEIVYIRICATTNPISKNTLSILIEAANFAMGIPKTSNDKFALITSAAFRNEPF